MLVQNVSSLFVTPPGIWRNIDVNECTCRSIFFWGGGGGGGGGQQNDAVITPIAKGIVFLSTVLPIDDYQGVTIRG